ncbi:MAG: twin-arginine translocase TatA/TatE family subunit [Chloroflexia bacterium]
MGGDLFGIGLGELLFIAVLALVIFGPKRLPEVGRAVGRFLRALRETTAEAEIEARRWLAGEMPEASESRPAEPLEGEPPAENPPPQTPLAG